MRSLEWRRWWRLPLFNLFRRRRAGKQKQEYLTTEAVPDIRYEGESFRMVEGLDDVKVVLERSLRLQRETLLSGEDLRLHILLAGPPGIAKTMLLMSAEREIPQERRVFLLGSQVSKAGLRNKILENSGGIDFILIDELDKMGRTDYDVLLSLMQTGRLSVLKAGLEADITCMATVLATANYLEKIPAELLDRFMILYIKGYGLEDFERVAVKILTQHNFTAEAALRIARTMWYSGFRGARDVLRVARFSCGDEKAAYTCLGIMRYRSPPEGKHTMDGDRR
jgi:Holliday junction resolvasome RuvABC ATP-dependent DNA helicase subunit